MRQPRDIRFQRYAVQQEAAESVFSQVEEKTITVNTKSPARLAAVSLAALFALTGCSSSEAFDFTEPSMEEPVGSIEFRVPDELVELDEDYAENRVFESVTLAAVESDDPSECAVEYQFDYVDDGRDHLIEFIENNPNDQSGDERMASVLTGESPDSIEFSGDYTSAEVPVSCATSPTDDEDTARVSLTWTDEEEGSVRGFARAYVAVMQGGELHVQETEVMRDWELDSNGNWIQ